VTKSAITVQTGKWSNNATLFMPQCMLGRKPFSLWLIRCIAMVGCST